MSCGGPLKAEPCRRPELAPHCGFTPRVPVQRDPSGRAAGPGPVLDLAEMDIISVPRWGGAAVS